MENSEGYESTASAFVFEAEFSIYSMKGQLLKRPNGSQADICDLPASVYQVRYTNAQGTFSGRFIKLAE